MKIKIALFSLLLFAALFTAHAQTCPVKVIAKDALVYVKMDKQMLGGNIQVRDSAGHVVSAKHIDHCKMYMDLFDLQDGKYTVVVEHNKVVVEFTCTLQSPQIHARKKHGHLPV